MNNIPDHQSPQMNILSKFKPMIIIDKTYVSAVLINDLYKTIPRKSGSTQKKLIKELRIIEWQNLYRRHKDKTKVGTIATRVLDQFKPQTQELYIEVNELGLPKEGPNKNEHIELLRLISELPDLATDSESKESESESEDELDQPIVVASAAPIVAPSTTRVLMPIIELEEHEMFRDANDQVFPIEVRGERSKDKILFKAKDVAAFAENERLIKTMLDDRKAYQHGNDYQILETDGVRQWRHQNPRENSIPLLTGLNSSANGRGINHDLVYLTLAGLLRVAAVSRNMNENLVKLFDWLQNLFYVHQFGSYKERADLAQDLLKSILNERLSGLYCKDLGTFADLYDPMGISRETYPPEQYSNYHLYKYGLSKDIATRLTQHQNKTSGYGRWSDKIVLKWMVLLSDSQLSEAEGLLSEKFKAKGLSFAYTDDTGKAHNELIAVGPKDEAKVKTIYKQTVSYFPSKENDLCKSMAELQVQHEFDLLKLESESTKKLTIANEATVKAQHETQLIKGELERQSLSHQIEMLQMQLKLANSTSPVSI